MSTEFLMRGDPDSERQALATMLLDPDLVVDATARHRIAAADFVGDGHAQLFEVLRTLVDEGSSVDPTLVRTELVRRYGMDFGRAVQLANLGGAEGIVGSPLAFEGYIEQLKRAAQLRRFETAVRNSFQLIESGQQPADSIPSAVLEVFRHELPEADRGVDEEEVSFFDADEQPEPTEALGWVAQYASSIAELTASPRSFNLLNGLALGATAVGSRAKLSMTFGVVRANLYGCVVGASSVFHKSTAMSRARDVLRRAGLDRSLLPESGTSEGLIAALAEQPAGLIMRDEVGRLFASDRIKHLATLKADLTDLFAGESIRKRLAGSDVFVERPCLSILGATTPARFFDAVNAGDWDDGFLVRWLFALPDGPPRFETSAFYLSEVDIDRTLNGLAQPLRMAAAQPETSFRFEGEAFAIWDEWQRNRLKRSFEFGDETALAIASRTNTAALKLAMVVAAVNGEWGRIVPERMAAAIWLADLFRRNLWSLLESRQQHTVGGHKLAKVLQVAVRSGAAGCTRRQLMRGAHLKSHELRAVLDRLLSLGALIPADADGKRFRAIHERLPIKNYA